MAHETTFILLLLVFLHIVLVSTPLKCIILTRLGLRKNKNVYLKAIGFCLLNTNIGCVQLRTQCAVHPLHSKLGPSGKLLCPKKNILRNSKNIVILESKTIVPFIHTGSEDIIVFLL